MLLLLLLVLEGRGGGALLGTENQPKIALFHKAAPPIYIHSLCPHINPQSKKHY